MDGKTSDAGIEVAVARLSLRRLGHAPGVVEAMTTEDVLLERVVQEAISEKAADDARVAAWFQRAAKDATQIRVQPLPEVSDG